MVAPPATRDAIELFHRGMVTFEEVEHNGMRVDVPYLRRTEAELRTQLRELEAELRGMPEFRYQQKRFGTEATIGSDDQLGVVLQRDMGYEFTRHKRDGKPVMDDTVLEAVGTPYTNGIREYRRLTKLHGTYICGILNEQCDGYVHCSFNLNRVVSFRSSASDPNFQNMPIREGESAKLIRRAFIPRDGHCIVDLDYSAQEVRVACSVSGDPKLRHDTLEGDMHRDMAAECFMLPKERVSKVLRGLAKGGFVFAEFYGDWYKQVTQTLWGSASKEELKTADGVPVIEHLRGCGIVGRGECSTKSEAKAGTFEKHIKDVEDRFWNERYRVYHEYRKQLVDDYRRNGWFQLVTGFTCSGLYTKNQVINYPVQGPAFHCLLWSMVRLNAEMKRRRMRSVIIGQIHDSIVADVHRAELHDYVELATQIATVDISRAWRWITTPLAIEVEHSSTNWFEKVPYTQAA